jgi:hypothetical protein
MCAHHVAGTSGPGPGSSMTMPHHLSMLAHGPSMTSLHGPLPPPPLCNPCSSQPNNFNSVPLPGPSSRWGPRTSCPVHSPFRARIPNGSICSGHQVNTKSHLNLFPRYHTISKVFLLKINFVEAQSRQSLTREHINLRLFSMDYKILILWQRLNKLADGTIDSLKSFSFSTSLPLSCYFPAKS